MVAILAQFCSGARLLPMVLALLSGFAPGSRKRIWREMGEEDVFDRMRFPQPEWLLQSLQSHGGLHLLDGKVGKVIKIRDSANAVACPLIVSLRAGAVYTGALTPWCKHTRLLWHSMACPLDAYSCEIAGAVAFDPPLFAEAGMRRRSSLWGPNAPVQLGGSRMQAAGTTRALTEEQACDALGVTVDEWTEFLKRPLCMLLPDPILHLIAAGAWPTVLACASWLYSTIHRDMAERFQFPQYCLFLYNRGLLFYLYNRFVRDGKLLALLI